MSYEILVVTYMSDKIVTYMSCTDKEMKTGIMP